MVTSFYLYLITILCLSITVQCVPGAYDDPIMLVDLTDARATASCTTSLTTLCYIQYTPSYSFHGTLEVRFYYSNEDSNNLPTQATYSAEFCNQSNSECDFIGEKAYLRNLYLEDDFYNGSTQTFSIKSSNTNALTLYASFYINNGTTKCLNDDCGGNGTCVTFNSVKQCQCNGNFAGRGCEIPSIPYWPNSSFWAPVAGNYQKIVSFTYDSKSYKDMFSSQKLTLKINGNTNNKCLVTVILADSQLQDGYVFQFKESSLNINDIFSNDNQNDLFFSTNVFSLLIFINNSGSTSMLAGLELSMEAQSDSSSSTKGYIILVVIAFVCLFLLVLILGCVHWMIKRRSAALPSNNESQTQLELPTRQTYVNKKAERIKDTEKEFLLLFNKKVPTKMMTIGLLAKLKKESNCAQTPEQKISSIKSEDDQHNGVCSICIMLIEVGGQYRKTLCNHYFHSECLEAWIKKQRTCPMCRMPHDIQDLEKQTQKQLELHKIQGKPLQFEMFVNPVSTDNNSATSQDLTEQAQQRARLGSIESLTMETQFSNLSPELSSRMRKSVYSQKDMMSSPIVRFQRSAQFQLNPEKSSSSNGSSGSLKELMLDKNKKSFSMQLSDPLPINQKADQNYSLGNIFEGMNQTEAQHSSVILEQPSQKRIEKLQIIPEEKLGTSITIAKRSPKSMIGFKISTDSLANTQLPGTSDNISNLRSSQYNQTTFNFMKSRLLTPGSSPVRSQQQSKNNRY